jgi:hypothetical protein
MFTYPEVSFCSNVTTKPPAAVAEEIGLIVAAKINADAAASSLRADKRNMNVPFKTESDSRS